MRRLLTATLVLLVAWTLFPGESTAADRYVAAATRPLASIKFDPEDDCILIPVRFGAKDYHFLLDTGSACSIFDVTLRSNLGPRIDAVRMATPDGHQIGMDLYNPPDARVSSLPLSKDPVACYDFALVREASGSEVYGVAGLDFFKDRIVTIDFGVGRIDVLPAETKRDPTWGECLSIGVSKNKSMRILAQLGERVQEPFIVDTGNTNTGDLSDETLGRLAEFHDARITGTDECMTLSGSSSRQAARVSRLSLGSFHNENLRFTSAQENSIGLGYLSRYRVTIDVRNERLYLAKGKHFADHDRGNTCGLHVLFKAGKPVVEFVDAKSTAGAAGIRPMDVIVKLSAQPVSKLKASQLRRLLSAEGKPVRLTIERDGKQLELSYIPKEYD